MLVQMIQQVPDSVAATLPSGGLAFTNIRSTACCFAGIRIDSDGSVYSLSNDGVTYSFVGAWLLNGLNSEVQIVRTIDSGTLSADAGAGPLVLTSDRDYEVQECVAENESVAVITLELQRVSDSVALASRQYTLTAILS